MAASKRRLAILVVTSALGLALLVAAIAAVGLARGWWRIANPDPRRFPVWGVDVSHHQGRIDWRRVARAPHVSFAYVKATEGSDWTDPRFRDNRAGASAAGLRVGAYHFFSFCRTGREQAAHFLAVISGEPGDLPPALDVELGGRCRSTASPAQVLREIDDWLDVVGEAIHRRPIIYVTQEAYELFFAHGPAPAPLWIRSLWREPRVERWAVWQFAHRGHVSGIDSYVDLDVLGDELNLPR